MMELIDLIGLLAGARASLLPLFVRLRCVFIKIILSCGCGGWVRGESLPCVGARVVVVVAAGLLAGGKVEWC